MIPQANIVEWSNRVHWPTLDQVEQDLVLKRLIVEIANDPFLGDELVFRGGTCLHKFHLAPALRYSEDLDYVRRSADGVGELFDAVLRFASDVSCPYNLRTDEWNERKQRGEDRTNRGPYRPRAGGVVEGSSQPDRSDADGFHSRRRIANAPRRLSPRPTRRLSPQRSSTPFSTRSTSLRPLASRCRRLRDDLISSSSSVERRRVRLSPPRRSRRS